MSILIFLLAIGLLIAGYVFYGNYIVSIFGLDKKRITPALAKEDGVDYVPAKNWLVIFGHHFASIAGAGPIIGPILAYIWWGWLGAMIWIILGTIFMGAVHDFSSLFISLREEGFSVGQIAQKYISKRAGIFFLIFLWFALVIIIAIFAAICAKSFISQPPVVVSSLGLIPVAILVGFLIYRLRVNIVLATLLGIISLVFLLFLGQVKPLVLNIENPYFLWTVILLVYAFFASITPVNILLQPRDYLSSFLLFFGIAVAFIGLLSRPYSISGAKLINFQSEAGYIFPMMFITIACGAISGFHSLVASGTTSKQITSEGDAKKIGYGAMVLEGVLALIVLFSVAFGLKNIPQGITEPADIFSLGFAKVAYFLGNHAKYIALVILNAFILTTLDTATRIARFITQELFNINNKWLSTGLVVFSAGYLALMDKWKVLWPIFGASNQLVAGLALIVASGWLFCKKKKYYVTFIPAIIMIIITILALALQVRGFLASKNYLLSVISFILISFGILGIFEFRKMIRCRIN